MSSARFNRKLIIATYVFGVFLTALLFVFHNVAQAATGVPKQFSYQGRLYDSSGNLLGGAGTAYCFKYSIYDSATVGAGTRLWPSGLPTGESISVRYGVFNFNVGSGTDALTYNFADNSTVYLQVEAATKVGALCTDGDETYETIGAVSGGRQQIVSSGFAINAGNALAVVTPNNAAGASDAISVTSGTGTTSTGAVTVNTGNASAGTAGNISIDVGTSTSSNGSILIGTAARAQTITIGNSTGGTITIGASSGSDLALQDAQWSVTGAGVATLANATITAAGAASTPAENLTGTWFTGGTGTTTKPQLLVEPTGATSTGWNTAGTGLGVNSGSGFTGALLDLKVNGATLLWVDASGSALRPPSIIRSNVSTLVLQSNFSAASNGTGITFQDTASSHTNAGTFSEAAVTGDTFAPTSGAGIYNSFNANSTINQTATATGSARSFSANPTVTSSYDLRGFDATFTLQGALSGSTAYGSNIAITNNQITNANTVYGQKIGFTDAGTLANTVYGQYVDVTTANASDTTYAAILQGGNVGIGDTTPLALLTVGNGDLFQVNSSGTIAAVVGITSSGNYIQSTGNVQLATNVSSGTGTSSGLSVVANSLTSGYGSEFSTNSITNGGLLRLTSTSIAGTGSGTHRTLDIASSGANTNASHTSYGIFSSVINTGSTSTDVAGWFQASGATNNYAIIAGVGNVGIGDSTPLALLTVGNGDLFQVNSSGAIAAVVGITSSSDYVQSTGKLQLTTNVSSGTGTSAGLSVTANSLTTGNGVDISSTSVTSGNLVNIASTSTAAASSTLKGVNIAISGANGTIAQTVYGQYSSVTNTNATSGTNIAGYFTASGATTANYAIQIGAGQFIENTNGALSAPGALLTGTWITGGTGTTTKPYALIETTGATSNTWSTSGTGLGVNAATGFVGNLLDLQLNGVSKAKVDSTGVLTVVSCTGCSAGAQTPWAQDIDAASFNLNNLGASGNGLNFKKELPHTLQIADTTTAATAGGDLTIKGAAGNTTGTGGALLLTAGAGGSGAATGGGITITTGAGGGTSGNSGALALLTGNTISGTAGNISIDVGTSTSSNGSILIGTAARAQTITIGNTSGGVITLGATSGSDLVLQDAQWSVTGAGVASFITGTVIGSQTFTTNNIADSGALTIASGTSVNNLTVRSGNNAGGASGSSTFSSGTGTTATGLVTLASGNASAGTAGNIALDVGTSTSGNGSILIGTAARVQTITIGNTSNTAALTLNSGVATGTGAVSAFVHADTALTSGTGIQLTVGDPQVNANGGALTLGKLINVSSADHSYLSLDNRDLTVGGHKNQTTISNVQNVFVYDTTRDRDGGRWTSDERAQSSSWYNEVVDHLGSACIIGTDDRCGIAAFPDKSILVVAGAAGANTLYIFDAKDNSLWMTFTQNAGATVALGVNANNTLSSVYAMNGNVYVGTNGSASTGAYEINFKTDKITRYNATDARDYASTIVNRNAAQTTAYADQARTGPKIISATVNDVFAQIVGGKTYFLVANGNAIAANGGISVINETNQTTVNLGPANENYQSLFYTADDIVYGLSSTTAELDVWYSASSKSGNNATKDTFYDETTKPALWSIAPTINTGAPDALFVTNGTSDVDGQSNTMYVGHNAGLSVIEEKVGDETAGAVKYYTGGASGIISEELFGDIRTALPLASTGTIATGTLLTTADADVSVKVAGYTTKGTNGMTHSSGIRGTAGTFDGTNYLCTASVANTCANNANLDVALNNFSLGFWIKTASSATTRTLVNKMTTPGSNTAGYIVNLGGGHLLASSVTDGTTLITATSTKVIDDNLWHHVVVVENRLINNSACNAAGNSCTVTQYIDGVQDGQSAANSTQSGSMTNATQMALMGNSVGANLTTGTMDEFFFTATTVTASQAKFMYDVGNRALNNPNHAATTTIRNVAITADNANKMNGSSVVKAVNPLLDNGLLYLGTSGGVSIVGIDTDTLIDLYSTSINTKDDINTNYDATNGNAVNAISVSKGYGTGVLLGIGFNNATAGGLWAESNDSSLKDFFANSYNPFGNTLVQTNLNIDRVLRVTNQISTRFDNFGLAGSLQPQLADLFKVDSNGAVINIPTELLNTNTTLTNTYSGLTIAALNSMTVNGAGGTSIFNGVKTTTPNITQTAGTISANGENITIGTVTTNGTNDGILLNLPTGAGSITTAGTINGLELPTLVLGPSAGTINGFKFGGITTSSAGGTINAINIGAVGTSGGTDTGINIGSGWDTAIAVTDSQAVANTLVNLTTSNTGQTGNTLGITTSSTGTVTNGLVRFNFNGIRTTAGVGFQIDDISTTLATTMKINANSLTTGNALAISATATGLTGSALSVTTGSTGQPSGNGLVYFNFNGIRTAAGVGFQITDISTTLATVVNLTANSLTTGNALAISATATGLTGNALSVTTGSTGAPSNGLVRFNFNGIRTAAGNGFQIDDISTTLATAMKINANSMTTGNGLAISATATGLTGNALSVTTGSTGTVSNGLVRFNFNGIRTSASNGFQIDDISTTLATTMKINANSLTTGNALAISATATGLTGNALSVTTGSTGVPTNGLVYFNLNGIRTAAGVGFQVTDISTTLATVMGITANSLTTGVGLSIGDTAAFTGTGLVQINATNASTTGAALRVNSPGPITGTNVVTGANSNSPKINLEGNGFTAGPTNTTGSFSIQAQPGSATTAKLMFAVTGWVANANLFSIDQAGAIRSASTDTNSVAPDIAENIPVSDPTIEAGDLVMVDEYASQAAHSETYKSETYDVFTAKKSTAPYQSRLLGVISTDPGIIMHAPQDAVTTGRNSADGDRLLALAGRTPLKVSAENGPIHAGDYLTSSSTPGVAMRALKAGTVIGKALENWDGTSVSNKILAFVGLTYFNGQDLTEFAGLDPAASSSLSGTSLAINTLAKFTAALQANPSPTFASELLTDRVAAGIEVITPHVTAGTITTATFENLPGSNLTATLEDTATFEWKSKSGPVVASIDAKGNALYSGNVTIGLDLTVVGKLVAQGQLVVEGQTTFKSDVTFDGRPIYNKDTAGSTIVKAGDTTVQISYTTPYATAPVVNATIALDQTADATDATVEQQLFAQNVHYLVGRMTAGGFTIVLNKPAPIDLKFNWTAAIVKPDQPLP